MSKVTFDKFKKVKPNKIGPYVGMHNLGTTTMKNIANGLGSCPIRSRGTSKDYLGMFSQKNMQIKPISDVSNLRGVPNQDSSQIEEKFEFDASKSVDLTANKKRIGISVPMSPPGYSEYSNQMITQPTFNGQLNQIAPSDTE